MSIYHLGKRYRKPLHLKDTPSNRKKARHILDNVVAKIHTGEIVLEDKTPTFEYYAKIYLLNKEKEVSKSTIYKYSLIAEKAMAYFKGKDIKSIKVSDVKNWTNQLTCGNRTMREYLIVAKGIFDEAFYDEVIKDNPVKFIKKPKALKYDIDPFTQDEVQLLLDNAKGDFQNYLAMAFYTGMRSGEILGLKWEDIDFNSGYINIKRTRSGFGEQGLKTSSSYRRIPIFGVLMPFLKKQFQSTGLINREVFLNQYKRAYKDSTVINDYFWKTLLRDCGIAYRRVYNTRHTFATSMLQSGDYSIMDISKILGHSSVQMVIQKYTKFIESETIKIKPKKDIYRQRIDIQEMEVPKIGS